KVIYRFDSAGKNRGGQRTGVRRRSNSPTIGTSSGGISITFLLVILLVALAVIVFVLVQNNIVGKKRITSASPEEQPEETENIFEINYQKEIEKAIADKNY